MSIYVYEFLEKKIRTTNNLKRHKYFDGGNADDMLEVRMIQNWAADKRRHSHIWMEHLNSMKID
jgi:hypothetical protein